MSVRIPIAKEADTRGGILPNCGAMSKRKLSEWRDHSPQRIHSFSTAPWMAMFVEEMCVQRVKRVRRNKRAAERGTEFSQQQFQQAA
jgi:hypothetical protein